MKKILFMTAAAVLMAVLTACPNVDSTEKRVTGITISPAGAVSVAVGGTTTLTAAVTPADAANQTITWSSNNTGRATVNASTGVVTGVSAGTVTIRASAADGSGVFANKDITVTAAGTGKTVSVGAQSGTMTAGVANSDVTYAVTTTGIAAASYNITVANRPTGVSSGTPAGVIWSNNSMSINASGTGTLTLRGSGTTTAGTHTNLTLTIDGATSAAFTLTISPAAPFSGAGTSASPYLIANATHLATMRDLINAQTAPYNASTTHYRQTANISLSGTWTRIGSDANRFNGTYDGGGFSISNLSIPSSASDNQGLFAVIGSNGVVRNVAMRNVTINSIHDDAGGIAGKNVGTIENCYVTGTISGRYGAGGISGVNYGVIKNCYTTCNVTSSIDGAGGISGGGINGTITNCYATGIITGRSEVGGITGSIIGSGNISTVERSVALNRSVIATNSTASIGRVVARSLSGSILYINFARGEGMTITAGGSAVSVTQNPTGIHGTNATAAQTHGASSGTWWSGTSNAPGFSSTNWDLAFNRLPHLKTTTGGAFNQTQNPTVP